VAIDVFDGEIGESGPPRDVVPISPFGYKALPNDRFPADLTFTVDNVDHIASAHIWPASQSGLPEFRLGGRPGSLGQGFYFYRNDRLLQLGGWNTLAVERSEYEYVRIAIDLNDTL
ncbi:ATP-binding protein, partial [Pseudomonas sp. BGM005]|nr:ATP-binding protein [Pseudomonas sp. BG5]